MKNKGLIMIALILAFCGVLSVYALTEGSTERIAVDAVGKAGAFLFQNPHCLFG